MYVFVFNVYFFCQKSLSAYFYFLKSFNSACMDEVPCRLADYAVHDYLTMKGKYCYRPRLKIYK
jgi:hypothetical protein